MNSVIKIVIGIALGAVGTWFFLKPATLNTTSASGNKQSTQQEERGSDSTSSALDSTKGNIQQLDAERSESVELDSEEALEAQVQSLQAALREKETQLVMERQSKKSALSKLEQLAGEDVELGTGEASKGNKYFDDIPEDYHKLLDPPKRRKDLPELHRDLVDEEQDLNWGLAMEQQIKSFVMNHPNSNYLHDFRVMCKTTMCELMAKVATENAESWNELCIDMAQDGWWEFTGTSSSGSNTADGKYYINVRILTRARNLEKGNVKI